MESSVWTTIRAILLALAVGTYASGESEANSRARTFTPSPTAAATALASTEATVDAKSEPTGDTMGEATGDATGEATADATPRAAVDNTDGSHRSTPADAGAAPPSPATVAADRAGIGLDGAPPLPPDAERAPEAGAAASPDGTQIEEPSSLKAVAPYLKYGPWAILVIFVLSGIGLHLSEDFILIPAGFLIAHGEQLPLWETLIAAYVGLVIGDLLWILLCRRYGTRMVQSRWFKRIVHPRRLLEAKHQMELRGIMVVVLARFVPGTRTPTITMAGILHLSWWKLVAVEFCACAVTVPLQVGIGYLAGRGMGESKSMGELLLKLIAATAAVALLGLIVHWWVQRRKTVGRAPRSKAAWLRTFGRRRRDSDISASAG